MARPRPVLAVLLTQTIPRMARSPVFWSIFSFGTANAGRPADFHLA